MLRALYNTVYKLCVQVVADNTHDIQLSISLKGKHVCCQGVHYYERFTKIKCPCLFNCSNFAHYYIQCSKFMVAPTLLQNNFQNRELVLIILHVNFLTGYKMAGALNFSA